jgi:uncharacterized membrane protein YcjF (UPF0283 family)
MDAGRRTNNQATPAITAPYATSYRLIKIEFVIVIVIVMGNGQWSMQWSSPVFGHEQWCHHSTTLASQMNIKLTQ